MKLPSDNPPAPHPLLVHLTPGTHGREPSASVASAATALESNQITNRLRLRRLLQQIKYVDGFWRMTMHSVLLLLLSFILSFHAAAVVVLDNGRVCGNFVSRCFLLLSVIPSASKAIYVCILLVFICCATWR